MEWVPVEMLQPPLCAIVNLGLVGVWIVTVLVIKGGIVQRETRVRCVYGLVFCV